MPAMTDKQFDVMIARVQDEVANSPLEREARRPRYRLHDGSTLSELNLLNAAESDPNIDDEIVAVLGDDGTEVPYP